MPDEMKFDIKIPDDVRKLVSSLLPIREIRIIPTQAKSPANEFVDIIEIELALPNDGNCDWMEWLSPHPTDCLRFRCEHGKAERLMKAMGLK